MVAPIGVKFCMMVHIGPEHKVSPFWGAVAPGNPKIPNFWPKFWPLNRKYLENGKSQRHIKSNKGFVVRSIQRNREACCALHVITAYYISSTAAF